jgi:uncharacterized protein (TIGR03437 family)
MSVNFPVRHRGGFVYSVSCLAFWQACWLPAILVGGFALEAFGALPTTITLSNSPNPATLGQLVTLTAMVTPVAATGKVTFYDGMTLLGIRPLAGGQAAFTTSAVPFGARSIRAYYSGDNTYAAASSAVVTQNIGTIAADGFGPAVNYSTGNATCLALGDFNEDGKTDLIVGDSADSRVSLLLGNGDGTFQKPTYLQPELYDEGLVSVADFNGDGHDDLMVAGPESMAVLLGKGDGTFQPAIDILIGGQTDGIRAMAVGDFNGDGIPDLAVVNQSVGTMDVYLSNGDGTFHRQSSNIAGSSPYWVAVGDFNGDGIADAVVANHGDGSLSIFLGHGDGSFQPKLNVLSGVTTPYSVVVADLNGDGRADLAVADDRGNLSVLLGKGDGTFQHTASYTAGAIAAQAIAVSDFNGDGKPDLAVANVLNNVTVLFGNGDGTFQAPGGTIPSISNYLLAPSVVVGDFNGDGKADVSLVGYVNSYGGASVLLGGAGKSSAISLTSSTNPSIYDQSVSLTATVSSPAGGTPSGTVTFFDGSALATRPLTNGETVLTTSFNISGPHWLTAAYNGDQTYFTSTSPQLVQMVNLAATTTTLASPAMSSVFGESVMLVANVTPSTAPGNVEFHDGSVRIGTQVVNGGVAVFMTSALSAGKHSLAAVYTGDYNYSGSTSAALTHMVAPAADTSTSLTSSVGQANLGQNVTLTARVSPAAATGKVTFYDGVAVIGTQPLGAGQATLATSLLSAGTHVIRARYAGSADYAPSASMPVTTVIMAQPANGFRAAVPLLPTGYSIAEGDFNGDGKADLAVIDSRVVSVLLGNGDGTFQPAVTSVSSASPGPMAAGDLNGDGKMDLVVNSGGSVTVLLGNGDGTFQLPVDYPNAGNVGTVLVGDFNGDGKLDVAINGSDVKVLFGNGDGTLQPWVSWIPNHGFATAGDFNGDGKIDFISNGTVLLGNDDGTFQNAGTVGVVVGVGDFNGDGKTDLIVTTYTPYSSTHPATTTFSVVLGRGDGTFISGVTVASFPGTSRPLTVAVGDFNGDGRTDIAMYGNPYPNATNKNVLNVYLGHGDGTFGTATTYNADASSSMLVGDFNGFGISDLAVLGLTGVSVVPGVLLPTAVVTLTSSLNPSTYGDSVTLTATLSPASATGTVTFYDTLTYSNPFYSSTTAVDIATVVNGQAAWTTKTFSLGRHQLTATYSGDANFFGNTSAPLNQTVSAAKPLVTLTSSANPSSFAQSILLTATVSDAFATGGVTFMDGRSVLGTSGISQGVAKLPVSTLSVGSHSLAAVYVGDSNDNQGTSPIITQTVVAGVAATVTLTASSNPATYGQSLTLTAGLSAPDATGLVTFYDGIAVLGTSGLVAGQTSITINVLPAGQRRLRAYYSGDGTYNPVTSTILTETVSALPGNSFQAPGSQIGKFIVRSMAVGDFNGDGIPDLVFGEGADNVDVLLGNGDGTFQAPLVTNTGGYLFGIPHVAVADFNGDGKADLIVGFEYGYGVNLLLGNGDGTFQPPVAYTASGPSELVAVGDFNGDGRPDVLVGAYACNCLSVNVLLGNGDGTFNSTYGYDQNLNILALTVGDFNGDGVADIAVINSNYAVSLLLGKGDGTFKPISTGIVAANSTAVRSGDFNGDGKADLAFAANDGTVSVALGNGDGSFQPASQFTVGLPVALQNGFPLYGLGLDVADINGDGNVDLVVTNSLGVAVLRGKGDGTFQDPVYYGSGSFVAVADFNGDGITDLASDVSVLLGSPAPIPSISSGAILNAASLAVGSPVAAGSLATAYGSFLVDQPAAASDSSLPNELSGLSVQIGNSLRAPLLAVASGKVTFQFPWELAGQSQLTVAVTKGGQTSAPQTVKLAAVAPGIFTTNGLGTGQAVVYDSSNQLVDLSNPTTAGATIQIFCTGLGPVSNQPATGSATPADTSAVTATIPTVNIGNKPAPVLNASLVPGLVGVYQVNAVVPARVSTGAAVQITVGTYFSISNPPTIAVK